MRAHVLTAQPHAHVRFRRAIERRALWLAEDAARELPNLPLEEALQLVHLYAEHGSPNYEKAALGQRAGVVSQIRTMLPRGAGSIWREPEPRRSGSPPGP